MNDFNKFLATQTGKVFLVLVLLGIGFFGGMQYKAYQIKSVITDSLMPAITSSLDDARTKSQDAQIRASVSSLRAQGVLSSADGGYTYPNICSDPDFAKLITSAETASGNSATCNISKDTANWAVAVPLKSDPDTFACSDSNGMSVVLDYPLGSATTCSK